MWAWQRAYPVAAETAKAAIHTGTVKNREKPTVAVARSAAIGAQTTCATMKATPSPTCPA